MTAPAGTTPIDEWLELRRAVPLPKPARSPRRLLANRARPTRNLFGHVPPLMAALWNHFNTLRRCESQRQVAEREICGQQR
jgi:hypothetical protein